jgi:hypothetical protein
MKHLASLINNTKLSVLNLHYSYIEDEGLKYLCESLRSNQHLKTLILSRLKNSFSKDFQEMVLKY